MCEKYLNGVGKKGHTEQKLASLQREIPYGSIMPEFIKDGLEYGLEFIKDGLVKNNSY